MAFSSPVAITEFSKFGDLLSAISQVALVLKNLPANVGDMGDNSLQYFCLGYIMDRGAWQAKVHGVQKNQT